LLILTRQPLFNQKLNQDKEIPVVKIGQFSNTIFYIVCSLSLIQQCYNHPLVIIHNKDKDSLKDLIQTAIKQSYSTILVVTQKNKELETISSEMNLPIPFLYVPLNDNSSMYKLINNILYTLATM